MIHHLKDRLFDWIIKELTAEKDLGYHKYLYQLTKRYVLFYRGENNADMYTNGEVHFLRNLLKKTQQIKTVFDVGANVGEFTAEIQKLNPKINIHCFEPDTRAFFKLRRKFHSQKRVIVNHLALSDKSTQKEIYLNKKIDSWTSFHPSPFKNRNDWKKSLVETMTLDEYCKNNQVSHINLLKIDAEGHDFFILLGAKNLLKKSQIDIIQFEYGDASKYARVFFYDFIKLFQSYGYKVYKVMPTHLERINYKAEMEKTSYANFIATKKD